MRGGRGRQAGRLRRHGPLPTPAAPARALPRPPLRRRCPHLCVRPPAFAPASGAVSAVSDACALRRSVHACAARCLPCCVWPRILSLCLTALRRRAHAGGAGGTASNGASSGAGARLPRARESPPLRLARPPPRPRRSRRRRGRGGAGGGWVGPRHGIHGRWRESCGAARRGGGGGEGLRSARHLRLH